MRAHKPQASGRPGRIDMGLVATLQAILETGNASKAAVALGVTQPAISQNLRRLREHFDDELFVRSGNTLQPTPRMLALQPMVEQLLRDLEMLSRPQPDFDPLSANQEFILCMSEFVEFAVLPSLAEAFARHAPQCRLRGMRAHHAQLQSLLEQGKADLAIGSLVGAAPTLRQQRLADHPLVCMVSARGRWASQPPSLQDYAEGRHVAVLRASDSRDPISERLQRSRIQRNVVTTVSSDFVAAKTVIATDALCTVTQAVGRQLAAMFAVKLQPLPFDAGLFTSRMIWHERLQRDASHIWLRQLVERAYRGWALAAPAAKG